MGVGTCTVGKRQEHLANRNYRLIYYIIKTKHNAESKYQMELTLPVGWLHMEHEN